jgi:hypothetical protein
MEGSDVRGEASARVSQISPSLNPGYVLQWRRLA